jgi:hypothetical protein
LDLQLEQSKENCVVCGKEESFVFKKNTTNPWRYYMYLKMNKIEKGMPKKKY